MTRSTLFTLLKAAVSLLLIWFLLNKIDLREMQDRLGNLSVGPAALAILFMAIQVLAGTERWRIVTNVMGFCLKYVVALRILMIGLFFNQTLPSSIGGDAVRIWLVTREGTTLGKSVNIVLGDRVLGLVVLIVLMGITLPLLNTRIPDPAAKLGITVIVVVGLSACGAFVLLGTGVATLLRRFDLMQPLANLAVDFRRLFDPAALMRLAGWSVAIHVLTVATIQAIGSALNVTLGFLDCLVIVPAVILATTIPVSVAGWGVREGAMVFGFGQIGVAPVDALAISVCFGLAQLIVGLPGGLIWLQRRHTHPS